jgi:hypothetical protein
MSGHRQPMEHCELSRPGPVEHTEDVVKKPDGEPDQNIGTADTKTETEEKAANKLRADDGTEADLDKSWKENKPHTHEAERHWEKTVNEEKEPTNELGEDVNEDEEEKKGEKNKKVTGTL